MSAHRTLWFLTGPRVWDYDCVVGVNYVVLVAAGSGIAPIRAAIESEMLGLKKVRSRGPGKHGEGRQPFEPARPTSSGSLSYLVLPGVVCLLRVEDVKQEMSITARALGGCADDCTPPLCADLWCRQAARYSKLYYGVRTPKHLAYTERFDLWREKGVEVVPVYSRVPVPMGTDGYWGYIQVGPCMVVRGVPIQMTGSTEWR